MCLDQVREAGGIRGDKTDAEREELERTVAMCEPLKGSSHICLVGSGIKEGDDEDAHVFALHLTSIGFPYVSTLRGGFRAAVVAAREKDAFVNIGLADFDPAAFVAASARRITDRKARLARRAKLEQESRAEAESRAHVEAALRAIAAEGEAREAAEAAAFDAHVSSSDADAANASNVADAGQGRSVAAQTNVSSSPASPRNALNSEPQRRSKAEQHSDGLRVTESTERARRFSNSSLQPQSSDVSKHPPTGSLFGLMGSSNSSSSGPGSDGSAGPTPHSGDLPQLRRFLSSFNSNQPLQASGADPSSGAVSAENSPRIMDLPNAFMSPRPGVQAGHMLDQNLMLPSPVRQRGPSKSSGGLFAKSPWGRDAKPGWLSDESLAYPLSAMPKGFTVNVTDDRVMAGLRLFPCRARSDNAGMSSGKSAEFKRRYVGVCSNYFMLLSPHSTRTHVLEVKLIRLLQDIVRITFKRSRPELVTFEILGSVDGLPNEQIVCIMPDGLTECVDLIKDYLGQNDDTLSDVDSSKVSRSDSAQISSSGADAWRESRQSSAEDTADTSPVALSKSFSLVDIDDGYDTSTPRTMEVHSGPLLTEQQLREGRVSHLRAGDVPRTRTTKTSNPSLSEVPRHVWIGKDDVEKD